MRRATRIVNRMAASRTTAINRIGVALEEFRHALSRRSNLDRSADSSQNPKTLPSRPTTGFVNLSGASVMASVMQ
jgi:hypothetical protein